MATVKTPKAKKPKITTGKYGGDDEYSWAVFRDGTPVFCGLCRGQLSYYKQKAAEGFKEAHLVL